MERRLIFRLDFIDYEWIQPTLGRAFLKSVEETYVSPGAMRWIDGIAWYASAVFQKGWLFSPRQEVHWRLAEKNATDARLAAVLAHYMEGR